MAVVMLIACKGSDELKTPEDTVQTQIISGYVIDDPVSNSDHGTFHISVILNKVNE